MRESERELQEKSADQVVFYGESQFNVKYDCNATPKQNKYYEIHSAFSRIFSIFRSVLRPCSFFSVVFIQYQVQNDVSKREKKKKHCINTRRHINGCYVRRGRIVGFVLCHFHTIVKSGSPYFVESMQLFPFYYSAYFNNGVENIQQ